MRVDQIPTIDIAFDAGFVNVGLTGYRLAGCGDENIYMIMSDIITNLEDPNGSASDLVDAKFIEKLQGRQEHFLGILSELGATCNQVNMLRDSYKLNEEIHSDRYSKLVDADIAEATIHWKTAQAMYEATLQATAGIIQPTILDFLR